VQASLGLINAIGGEWRTPGGGLVEQFIQTGVTMYPGFSGGPLVNAAGQVVGLNTSGLVRGMQPALPVATVRRVVEALLVHGRVRRGYLGVSAQPVRLPAAVGEQLGQEIGLLISAVEADSPAERAGLLLGDVLAALAGERIQTMDDLLAALSGDRVNTSVPARVVRGGKVNDIPVVIGERQ
jgi:S1-C subfamily serine protease